jgi:hypothetical protein
MCTVRWSHSPPPHVVTYMKEGLLLDSAMHREDILCLAGSSGSPVLLATGDYEGRINVYDMHTGERRLSLYHRANRYCTAIHCLLFLQPPQSAFQYLLSCGGRAELSSVAYSSYQGLKFLAIFRVVKSVPTSIESSSQYISTARMSHLIALHLHDCRKIYRGT